MRAGRVPLPGPRGPAGPPAVPPLRPGQPPLALLIDYDGTIATVDVGDVLIRRFSPEKFEADNAAYSAGLVGTKRLMEDQVRRFPADPTEAFSLAAEQPHDPTFAPFVERALGLGVALEVVSDGFGFYIEPALRRLGVPAIPVATSRTVFGRPEPRMEFPSGHPECFVCGTCKRGRVLAHQAAGRTVAFIGDGESDRYAALYADLVFAKRHLVGFCEAEGLAFTPWRDFDGIGRWLESTVAAWRSDSAAIPPHSARSFICGPEAWSPGRSLPPPGNGWRAPRA